MLNESTSIDTIEAKAKQFASARAELSERLQRLKDEQEAIKRRLLQGIRNAVARVRADYDELLQLVTDNPGLFDKPKTRVLHGIRMGWMKQRGKLEFTDAETVVVGLRRLLGEEAEAYIKTTETPIKGALANLSARDLQRVGVAVSDDAESPFVKAADSEIDKLIDALLGEDVEAAT